MQLETVVENAESRHFVSSQAELVRATTSSELAVQAVPVRTSTLWGLRFLLAAALGALGGLIAALIVNPAAPRFRVVPASSAGSPRDVAPPIALPPPVATTTVTVNAPSVRLPRQAAQSKTVAPEELARLKTRNRRLEALVQVLRQRTQVSQPTASPGKN